MIPRGLTARISGFHPGGPGSTPGVGNLLTRLMLYLQFFVVVVIKYSVLPTLIDEVAEWLRRWTANPMGSARVGSNPIFVARIFLLSLAKTVLVSRDFMRFAMSATSKHPVRLAEWSKA